MSFNPNVLTCLHVIVNDVLGETSYTVDTLASNINGFVWVEVAYYPPATPISTSAPVAITTIHFRVKSPGTTVLHLHDTRLTDQNSNPIPHYVSDGLVQTVIHDVAVTSVTPASSCISRLASKHKRSCQEPWECKRNLQRDNLLQHFFCRHDSGRKPSIRRANYAGLHLEHNGSSCWKLHD
jgi:hypothetical protein